MTADQALLFEVVAIASNGAVQSTRVAAQSEQHAAQQVQLGGLRVIACRGVAQPRRGLNALFVQRRVRLDIGLFSDATA